MEVMKNGGNTETWNNSEKFSEKQTENYYYEKKAFGIYWIKPEAGQKSYRKAQKEENNFCVRKYHPGREHLYIQ